MAQAPSTGPRAGPPPKVAATKQSPVWTPDGPRTARPQKRNAALIVVGALLTVIAIGFGSVFALNLYQYSTVESRWASDPASPAKTATIRITRSSDLRRMIVFGPAAAISGIPGILLLVLGLRKR